MRKGSGTTAKANLVGLQFCPKDLVPVAGASGWKFVSEAAGPRMLQTALFLLGQAVPLSQTAFSFYSKSQVLAHRLKLFRADKTAKRKNYNY